jgi:hypothetical protein
LFFSDRAYLNHQGTNMNDTTPVILLRPQTVDLINDLRNETPDPDLMEIEEAKKHFEDQTNTENYWAGRLLADRKTTRIAA